MIKLPMNKALLPLIAVNFVLLITLSYFYYRDVIIVREVSEEGCTPYGAEVTQLTKNSASIQWKTDSSCTSYIKIGSDQEQIDQIFLGENGYTPTRNHQVDLTALRPETLYYIIFFSSGVEYGDNGKPYEIQTLSL